HPNVAVYRKDIARHLHHLADLRKSHWGTAPPSDVEMQTVIESYAEGREILQNLIGQYPENRAYVFALAVNLHCAGHAHGRAHTPAHDLQAWDHFERARRLLDDLIASDATVPDYRHELGRLYKSMAVLERERKRPGDARTFCERAVALQQPLADKFPAVLKYR